VQIDRSCPSGESDNAVQVRAQRSTRHGLQPKTIAIAASGTDVPRGRAAVVRQPEPLLLLERLGRAIGHAGRDGIGIRGECADVRHPHAVHNAPVDLGGRVPRRDIVARGNGG